MLFSTLIRLFGKNFTCFDYVSWIQNADFDYILSRSANLSLQAVLISMLYSALSPFTLLRWTVTLWPLIVLRQLCYLYMYLMTLLVKFHSNPVLYCCYKLRFTSQVWWDKSNHSSHFVLVIIYRLWLFSDIVKSAIKSQWLCEHICWLSHKHSI